MAAPTALDFSNCKTDLDLIGNVVNGSASDVFINREGVEVKSLANVLSDISHANNPSFGNVTCERFYLNKTGGDTSAYIHLNSAVVESGVEIAGYSGVLMKTNYKTRWALLKNTSAESGDNAGSHFEIRRFSDAGDYIAVALTIDRADGGVFLRNASGGSRGEGTLNATAVYDDSSVLTCYVIEQWLHGEIDLEKWDSYVPDREIPTYSSDGEITGVTLEPRKHDRAAGFANFGADRLNIDSYTEFVETAERLPAFPGPDYWVEYYKGNMSTGDLIQRIWETLEIAMVFAMDARRRELSLQARIDALEAGQTGLAARLAALEAA